VQVEASQFSSAVVEVILLVDRFIGWEKILVENNNKTIILKRNVFFILF